MQKIFVNCRFATQELTGVQRYAIECALALKKLKPAESVFLSPKGKINNELKLKLNIKQIGFTKGHFWEQIELPIYCWFHNCLLFCFCGGPPIFYKNTVFTVHDLAFLRHPEFYRYGYKYFYRFLFSIAIKKSKQIVAVSEFTKSEIKDIFNVENIKIVNNSAGHLERNTDKLNLPSLLKNKNFLLAVGSNDPRKNLQQLIEVYLEEEPSFKLVIVGKKRKNFSNKSKILKFNSTNIIYMGELTDIELAACYAHAECLIYPSIYEGFGIPPLEAFYFNTPVAVSDISILREVCGEYAAYFDPKHIKNITKIVETAKKIKKQKNISKQHPVFKRYSSQNQEFQIDGILKDLSL